MTQWIARSLAQTRFITLLMASFSIIALTLAVMGVYGVISYAVALRTPEFFSNLGHVYRMKVWLLPEGGPNTKGRPMVNMLPLAEGETISTVLALPEDEAEWGGLHIMFATARGTVRRNSMDAFTSIRASGKRAMRFGAEDDEDTDGNDRLIGVELLTEGDDVLLATRNGKAIRFIATDVREFQ